MRLGEDEGSGGIIHGVAQATEYDPVMAPDPYIWPIP